MQSGKEYFDISPFWDYSKIPGTTAREESDEKLLSYEGWEEELESPCRASGTTADNCGILTEKAFHDGISVTASFFVFDGAMVALGADINDETPHKCNVYTTVEQCRAFSPVIKNNFVQNGGVFYKNLDSHTKFLSVSKKTQGSWSRNEYSESKVLLEEEILTITIPFEEYRSYSYLVYCKKEPNVRILRNDKTCQAIEINGNRIMAVFHGDASFYVDDKEIRGKKGEPLIK
jgi:chondroitin AC lyase